MTFLAPGWLAVGAAAALALVALHLLAIGRPPPMALPTARFVPARTARARRLARRPADALLLATRAAAVLLAAAALARPTRAPERRPVARVIVADRSAAARDAGHVRDSVRALAAPGDLLIAFDTAAGLPVTLGATAAARDSAIDGAIDGAIASATATGAAAAAARVSSARLSAALAAARRAAPTLRDRADSIELVVVSPLTDAEVDAATPVLRDAWAGRARVARVAAAPAAAAPTAVRVVARRGGVPDDALAAAASLGGGAGGGGARGAAASEARVVRDGVVEADRAWARDSGGVLLDWPAGGVPDGWVARPRVDTAGAVASGTAVFVAALPRRARWDGEGARVIARWADGEPAATERALGSGCVREIAVSVPQVGDAALRPPFLALLAALTEACAHRSPGAPLADADVRALAGTGALLAARALAAPAAPRDPLARWLLGAAIALLLVELPLRRLGGAREPAAADHAAAEPTAPARETAA